LQCGVSGTQLHLETFFRGLCSVSCAERPVKDATTDLLLCQLADKRLTEFNQEELVDSKCNLSRGCIFIYLLTSRWVCWVDHHHKTAKTEVLQSVPQAPRSSEIHMES
jgi:hypothetical protein